MGEPAYSECIRSWHESNHARDEHHLVTMLAVILGTTSVALVLARSTRVRVPGFRLGLALTAAAGCFAMLAAVVQFVYDGRGAGFAIGAALFALAAAIDGERHPRVTRVLAAIAGAILLLVAGLAWSMLFPGD